MKSPFTLTNLLAACEGRIAFGALFGLGAEALARLEGLAEAASFEGRHAQAAEIFEVLSVFAPERPDHLVSRAQAEASAGRPNVAIACLNRYLAREGVDATRALALRAELRDAIDPLGAAADRASARALTNPVAYA